MDEVQVSSSAITSEINLATSFAASGPDEAHQHGPDFSKCAAATGVQGRGLPPDHVGHPHHSRGSAHAEALVQTLMTVCPGVGEHNRPLLLDFP